jgi:hypothetical protein
LSEVDAEMVHRLSLFQRNNFKKLRSQLNLRQSKTTSSLVLSASWSQIRLLNDTHEMPSGVQQLLSYDD